MYHFRDTLGPVDLAFTDRFGGVSVAPYDELNLSVAGADDDEAKAANHRLLLADFAPGDRFADVYQVHGNTAVIAEPGTRPEADGIVTDLPGIVLMIRAADCVPVLLADPVAGVVGAAHAGRVGLAVGIVESTVARMRQLGARDLTAWIGPHVCGSCYEVPRDLQEQVLALVPAARAVTPIGTPSLDLGLGVRAQLEPLGVDVIDASACTRETPGLYSYRRDGAAAGRLAGVIRLRPRLDELDAA